MSAAKVVFLVGEETTAGRASRRLFGRSLGMPEYAALAGAPDDALVEVGASGGELYLEIYPPLTAAYRVHLYVRRERNAIVLVDDGFHIQRRALRGRGLGLHIVHRQAVNAARLKILRIKTTAGRREDENGYYSWPRFGFDGPLSRRSRQSLPGDLSDARTVLDLIDTEPGRLWWREHGESIRVVFDLAPGSRSWRALERYVLARIAPSSSHSSRWHKKKS